MTTPSAARRRPGQMLRRLRADVPLEVTFLGTAAASSIATAPTAAQLLRHGGTRLLVDAGRGAVAQLRRAGTDPGAISALLLTHWHPDHIAGLAQLLAVRRGRGLPPLVIHAPPPPRGMGSALGLGGRGGLETRLVVMRPGDQAGFPGATVTAVAADHVGGALAWHFTETAPSGRSVLFSGDTRPTPEIRAAARGVDLLVHEATFSSAHRDWAHRIGHTVGTDTGAIARDAVVGMLAVTHLSARDSRERIGAEVRAGYPQAIVATDLDVLEIAPLTRLQRHRALAAGRPGWARILHRSAALAGAEIA